MRCFVHAFIAIRACRQLVVTCALACHYIIYLPGAAQAQALWRFHELSCRDLFTLGAMGSRQMLPLLMLASVLMAASARSRSHSLREAIILHHHKTIGQDKVLEAIQAAADIDEQDEDGTTALMYAAWKADLEIVEAILKRQPKLDHQNQNGFTALMVAAHYNQPEVVEAILKHKPKLDLQDKDGWTALMKAARNRNPEMVEAILKHKPQLDLQAKNGWTALMSAARYRKPEVVEAILKHKPKLDLQNQNAFTALMVAARNRKPEVVEAILKHKPKLDLQSNLGNTALMFAARYNQLEVVEAILKHKPKLDLQDKDGWTALMKAARNRNPEMVEAILKHKPQLDLQAKNGWTALMSAARYRKPEVVEAILKHKPKLDLQAKTGATALFLAVQNEHGPEAAAAMVNALLRAGAALDLANFAGRTPLMKAAVSGRAAAAEVLLDHGSRPELRSRSGQNALDLARLTPFPFQSPSLLQRLEKDTPKGLDLARTYFASATTWKFLASGLAVGICAGACLVAMGKRGSLQPNSQRVTVLISSRRLAIKSLTKGIWKAEALRALELVACILLPLSMTMLWIEPRKFLPFYFLVYGMLAAEGVSVPGLAAREPRKATGPPLPRSASAGRRHHRTAGSALLAATPLRGPHQVLHLWRPSVGGQGDGLPHKHTGAWAPPDAELGLRRDGLPGI